MTKTIDHKEKKLTYQITGTGPTVVLLHGFGEDSSIWQQQQGFLGKNFQLIIPDLPASGDSEMMDDMSMESLAEAVYAILKQEQIGQCAMIGHSMGGYVTLAFAEKHPSLLRAFGLFHSTAFSDSEEKKSNRKKGIQFIQQHGAYEFLKTTIPNLYSSSTKQHHPSIIDEHLQQVHYFSEKALIAYYEAMMQRPDRTFVLKQNKTPVLFVLGRHDTAVPLTDGLKQAHMPDLSYIHILELSGHMGMKEEPEESNHILKDFLLKTV